MSTCCPPPSAPRAAATPTRPQLDPGAAAEHHRAAYFAKAGPIDAPVGDPWDPVAAGIGDVATFTPTCVVAQDGSGTHATLQAALDAVMARGGAERAYVLVKPGTYRGQAWLKDAPPVTLYGLDADPARVVIVDGKANGTRKAPDVALSPCEDRVGFDSYGTFASATMLAYADGFQAKNLTIANDYDEGPVARPGPQAVALSTRGDRVILENVHLISHQDTLALRSTDLGRINRVHVRDSLIAGDVDFVFGHAIAVFESVEFRSRTDRPGAEGDFVFAPSHPHVMPHGFLVTGCRFTSDGAAARPVHLGRAWDDSTGRHTATDGASYPPNGALVIRACWLGDHIAAAPWGPAATTGRPFNALAEQTVPHGNPKVATRFPPNRLAEFGNSGPGAAS
jgi:pectinesterase